MPVQIQVRKVRRLYDPFKECPWVCLPLTQADVKEAVFDLKALQSAPYACNKPMADVHVSPWPHAYRIAWLVLNGWNDPIEIDVGVPSVGYGGPCVPITDGNHRLAAAIYRKDKNISAVVSGCLKKARNLFAVDCTEMVRCHSAK